MVEIGELLFLRIFVKQSVFWLEGRLVFFLCSASRGSGGWWGDWRAGFVSHRGAEMMSRSPCLAAPTRGRRVPYHSIVLSKFLTSHGNFVGEINLLSPLLGRFSGLGFVLSNQLN